MKNSQSIIRLCLSIFLIFGIFQTSFGQTIDSMSKVILDKVDKEYASYETMQYQVVMMFESDGEPESDTINTGITQTMLRIENIKGAAVSNGKTIISLEKSDNNLDTMEYDSHIAIFWLSRVVPDFMQNGDISFVETIEENGKTIHILGTKIEDEAAKYAETPEDEGEIEKVDRIFYQFYIDANTNQILKFTRNWGEAKESCIYTNFKANPTFPDDYFEIKN